MISLLGERDSVPSLQQMPSLRVAPVPADLTAVEVEAVGLPVAASGDLPAGVSVSRSVLAAAGFDGEVGQATMIAASSGPQVVLYGVGQPGKIDVAGLRDTAAAFARTAAALSRLAITLPSSTQTTPELAAQALVEGVLLARYRYGVLTSDAGEK